VGEPTRARPAVAAAALPSPPPLRSAPPSPPLPSAPPSPPLPSPPPSPPLPSAPRSGSLPLTPSAPYSSPRGGRLPEVPTLARRRLFGRTAALACLGCLLVAGAPLIALVVYTVGRAAPALSFGLLTSPVAPAFVPGGGIGTAIAGSARAVGLGFAIAAPLGLLTALYLYERPGRVAAAVRFCADVLSGVPSILIGIFAYEFVVRPMHHPSLLAAGTALAVLMLPIMVRANEEAVRAVPVELQEAGSALGTHRWRVVRSIVLRGSLPGLVAGNLLALARAVGETAPLLFTLAAQTMALTTLIFQDGQQPYPSEQHLAWAAALVLLVAVLALSALARFTAWFLTRRAR
jgi:phosphate transport system permease protein